MSTHNRQLNKELVLNCIFSRLYQKKQLIVTICFIESIKSDKDNTVLQVLIFLHQQDDSQRAISWKHGLQCVLIKSEKAGQVRDKRSSDRHESHALKKQDLRHESLVFNTSSVHWSLIRNVLNGRIRGITEKRLRYARLHNWTEHDVLRRDECKFEIFGSNHSQHVRRTSGEHDNDPEHPTKAVKTYLEKH